MKNSKWEDIKFKNVLVIGLGEVGTPLLDVVSEVYNTQGLDVEPKKIHGDIDLLHICYPYSPNFGQTTINYINKFKPKLTIIESTVLPFTTKKIYEKTREPICHSPVRGRQTDGFRWAYLTYTKFIGPAKPEYGVAAQNYYNSLGFKTYVCHSPLETEFMKILNTTYYGLMITWFQEIHRICSKFGLKEEEIIRFFKTNEEDSKGKHPRPTFYPGVIRGHCVIPNAKLLNEIFPSIFVRAILQSNEKRQKEVEF
jgi:UDP-N-acetyl-D-mannosaminuronate dehydrogenase